jgi:hypothetical protein
MHTPETLDYLAIECGGYTLGNGMRIEAGIVQASSTHGLTRIRFGERFSIVPVVLTSIVSGHATEVMSARPTMISKGNSGIACKPTHFISRWTCPSASRMWYGNLQGEPSIHLPSPVESARGRPPPVLHVHADRWRPARARRPQSPRLIPASCQDLPPKC